MEAIISISLLVALAFIGLHWARKDQKERKALAAKTPKAAKRNYNTIVDAKLDEWVKENCLTEQNTELLQQLKGSEIF